MCSIISWILGLSVSSKNSLPLTVVISSLTVPFSPPVLVQDNLSSLGPNDSVTIHLWAGTNGDPVRAGSILLDHNTYLDKLAQVKDIVTNSSLNNKADLLHQLDSWFASSWFTNTDLHGMRCLETVEEAVKWAWNFAGKMDISYDSVLDMDSSVLHDPFSRMGQAYFEISKFIPGEPWQAVVEGWNQWLVFGLPRFSNTFKRKNDGKPTDKPTNKPIEKPWEKWNEWDKNKEKPWIILPPVKPDDPAWPAKEEPPRKKIKWKIRWIVTRWHPIADDIDDLWSDYPWNGELPKEDIVANEYIKYWKRWKHEYFTQEDIDRLQELEWNEDAQRDYLISQIAHDRTLIEKSITMERFRESMKVSKEWIKKFLPELVWNVDSELLNKFLSDDRIHVISDRDYIGITKTKNVQWVGWCFRSLNGDLFIRFSFLEQFDFEHDYIEQWNSRYAWIQWHEVLIHEMIHSMSTMNYLTSWEKNNLVYDPQRVGLRFVKRDKNWLYLWETWRSMNEAATESLTWEIVSLWFSSMKPPLDLSSHKEWRIAYKWFIDVLDTLEKTDDIERKDFWKAMLIRKRAKNKDLEWQTPLVQLTRKVNWYSDENWNEKYKRPSYYELISNSMDFAHKLFDDWKKINFDTQWIIDFIAKKDINILKDYISDNNGKLSDVFNNGFKGLLTKDGSDFKQEILDAYKGE